ncbi:unnamed protein product [Porites evermanni]|uniref:Uncharacterized protein n=1 Tax=Porites evermanni TaxID=104178 RepID=A0ABN8N5I9_9CNID|nr:unnamed protein product [Porites evermanni]
MYEKGTINRRYSKGVPFLLKMVSFIKRLEVEPYGRTMVYFLQFCNLSQTSIETQRILGTSCSSKLLSRYRANIGKERLNVINSAIKKALEQKHAIFMTIDDHHNIHTVRRPTEEGNTIGSHGYHLHQDCYMLFVRLVYESLFPGKNLADKQKPWRIKK